MALTKTGKYTSKFYKMLPSFLDAKKANADIDNE